MSSILNGKTYLIPLVIIGLGAMTVASAQTSGSPFSSKKKKQAWELDTTTVTTSENTENYSGALDRISTQKTPVIASPVSSNYTYSPPTKSAPTYESSTTRASDYLVGARPSTSPTYAPETTESGAYYPGRENPSSSYASETGPSFNPQSIPQSTQYQGAAPSHYQGQSQYNHPSSQKPLRANSWHNRLGLGNIKASVTGFLRGGVAATRANLGALSARWRDDYVADLNVEAEASAITQGGLEYGFNFEVRSQYDRFRRGFGGRVGDCPATVPGCASDGLATPTAVRGHTTQFYTDGPSNAQAFETAIEGAYIFLRSAYGDVTLGLDDGSAYLFSLGAPTLLAVNASNSPVDYTGLDSVKTVNDASGFAEKITYTSPRLLGDQIGFGVQVGASYAPNARACGVDYCVRRNGADGTGVLSPDLSDVIEFGAAIDRKFDNGINVEATFTYATASEDSGLAVFDDLESWNSGIEVSLNDWTVGGSYLQSNNGLTDGDYTAWDAGITWKPSKLGFTASYGHAEDENINLTSDQAVFGVSYEFDRFTLGTGVQYIERTVPIATGLVVGEETEKATAFFVEGGFTF